MKQLLLLVIISAIHSLCYSQTTVHIDSVATYEGKTITVCARVVSTFVTKGAKKVTYLNFGKPYPNSSFTVVIFESSLPNFTYNPAEYLKGKEICVTGKVKLYKGKPEMEIGKEQEIKE